MKKRYKLIKSYPGSPKLGTEVNYSETHQIYNYNGGDYYTELPKHQVENLPEFWQEIIELPVGTKVKDTLDNTIWTKVSSQLWEFNPILTSSTITEDVVGKGKRFEIIEEIPEYVECIDKSWFGHANYKFKVGQIYKWSDLIDNTIASLNKDFKVWKNEFKPSTKEDYEKQQQPKEYEILQIDYCNKDIRPFENVVLDYHNGKCTQRSDNKTTHNTVDLKEFTKEDWEKHITILKIRRISDNFIFQIGDSVVVKDIPFKISSFKIRERDNKILLNSENHNYICSLSEIQKAKLVLFTTEDKKEIREGDKFYEANIIHGVKEWTTDYPVYLNKDILKNLYSTKKAAENYIENHKPVLSFNDVWNISNNKSFDNNFVVVEKKKLQEFVKNKLKEGK